MNNSHFEKSLREIYPKLGKHRLDSISLISENILEIATHGSQKFSNLSNWEIIDRNRTTPLSPAKNILVRGAGQSRYNPMKWEGAYNLKEALKAQVSFYENSLGKTELGILVTDIWRPVELYEYINPIEKFERLGIHSIAILVSGNLALPIKWPWR